MLSTLQTLEYQILSEKLDIEIFDYIPSDDHKQYIVIGDVNMENNDTKTTTGYEVVSSIYVYGIEKSQINVKKILKSIHDCLKDLKIDINGYCIEYFKTMSMSSLRIDVDLVQGLIEIKYRLEED